MKIICPWNLEFYIPANGFHPLYLPFFEDKNCSAVSFDLLKTESKIWSDKKLRNELCSMGKELAINFRRTQGDTEIANRYLSFLNQDLQALIKSADPSLVFHHTIPGMPLGRPFFFHCESFLPIFMPFAYQGRGAIVNVRKVKELFRKIFESDECVSIGSHLQCTLDDISSFFCSQIINKKLLKTKIGLSKKYFNKISSEKKEKNWENPTFLFCHSHHQSPISLLSRGFAVFCKFVLMYVSKHKGGRFIFRCPKLSSEECAEIGVDLKMLELAAGDRIVWLPGYLPENEQLKLFAQSEFMILPSINLHSVVIMQALAAGTIPILTDTFGTDLYVKNAFNGVFIRGMRNIIWNYDAKNKYWYDRHDISKLAESTILNGLNNLFVREEYKAKDWELMSKNAIDSAAKNFSGKEFCADLKRQFDSKYLLGTRSNCHKSIIDDCLTNTSCANFSNSSYPKCESIGIDKQIISSNGIFSVFNRKGDMQFELKLLPPCFVRSQIKRSTKIEDLLKEFQVTDNSVVTNNLLETDNITKVKTFLGYSLIKENNIYKAIETNTQKIITCKSLARIYLKIIIKKIILLN